MKDPHQMQVKIVKGPPEAGPFREAWATMRLPFIRFFWRARAWWLLHRGIIHARRWRNPSVIRLLVFVLWFLAIVLAVWLIRSIVTVVLFHNQPATASNAQAGWHWGPFNPDGACSQVNTSCDAINSVLMPALLVATSTVIFLSWRLFRVRRFYKHKATAEANRLVQTAGSLLDEVIGRDYLCDALMNNLRDRKTRRPHVIVGGVGVGKTALMVHLTQRLAAIGAVPVPVRLRDVQQEKDLDFCSLARKRFSEIVEPIVRSNGEQDRTWRWLREQTGRVVVLADGLEEALSDKSMAGQRDNLIRTAIRKANDQELPLVIASRPHDPLRAMQAAITWLEPLSDEAALRYVSRSGSWRADPTLLDRVVEAAKMVESPLYLQIAKDLHSKDLLEPLWAEVNAGDLAVQDRWAFRHDLLCAWLNALVDGTIHPELPIDPDTRQAVVEYVSALACIGLASDSVTVALRDLDRFLGAEQNGKGGEADQKLPDNPEWRNCVAGYLGKQMRKLQESPDGRNRRASGCAVSENGRASLPLSTEPDKEAPPGPYMDVRLAATWGTRMGLVQESGATDPEVGSTVHFQHSIIQAYLGSRFLPAILSHKYPPEAAQTAHPSQSLPVETRQSSTQTMPLNRQYESFAEGVLARAIPNSGRELLIAFMLYSRSLDGRCTCAEPGQTDGQPCPTDTMRTVLTGAASRFLSAANKALCRVYAPVPEPRADSRDIDKHSSFSLRALECFGAAAEIASEDHEPGLGEIAQAVEDVWQCIGAGEDPVRLREAKITTIQQYGAAARRVARKHRDVSTYLAMFRIGCIEPDYHVRSEIAEQVGTSGVDAFRALGDVVSDCVIIVGNDRPLGRSKGRLISQTADDERPPRFEDDRYLSAWLQRRQRQHRRDERKRVDVEARGERGRWYQDSMRAWLLPLLVDSAAMTGHSDSPWSDLEDWVSYATKVTELPRAAEQPCEAPLADGERYGLGLALAQGFKYAANRRLTPQSNQEGREFLIKQAEELLRQSTFWYTRLTLLQALTLWALPDDVTGPHQIRGSGADPKGQVKEWLALPKGQKEHPLVKAAGKLAVRALQTRRPERFLWIDDADVASRIGTEVGAPGVPRFHNLWIPPSTGWSSLDPAAQQLLGDVLLLALLGERGYRPKDFFRVLERTSPKSPKLPSCLSSDRSRLDPVRAVDAAAQPGENCADDCGMKMCPYPGKAEKGLRLEFNEIFCLHERGILRAWQPRSWLYLRFRRESPWQRKVPVAGLRRFWDEMGERARDVSREGPRTARTRVRA
jgi:hypothetical protein